MHKKLAANPIRFQPSAKPNETRSPINRCRRRSNEDFCETHRRLLTENCADAGSPRRTFPTMPLRETEDSLELTVITGDQKTKTEEHPITQKVAPGTTNIRDYDTLPRLQN